MRLKVSFETLDSAIRRMGATPVVFDPGSESRPLDKIDIDLEAGIELPNLDLVDTAKGLLSYKGRQILLYIQDHGGKARETLEDGRKGNKFHVADCKTLQSMRSQGRYERYVVTNRLDGLFYISGEDWQTRQRVEGEARLWVCRNCLKTLNYKGARTGSTLEQARQFDITEFFSTYSSFFAHLPKRQAGKHESESYTKDWPQVAGRTKAEKDFVCEMCRVDLTHHKSMLHVHHRNGVKSDNSPANLQVLCACCHRKQPFHGHMFVPHKHTQTINRLRREQGLLQDTDWSEVLEYCDPALLGILALCRDEGAPAPEVGLDIQLESGEVVANVEVGWPASRLGIAINEDDLDGATRAGWEAWRVVEALESVTSLVARVRR